MPRSATRKKRRGQLERAMVASAQQALDDGTFPAFCQAVADSDYQLWPIVSQLQLQEEDTAVVMQTVCPGVMDGSSSLSIKRMSLAPV